MKIYDLINGGPYSLSSRRNKVTGGESGVRGGLDDTPHPTGNDRSPVELSHSGGLSACHLSVFILK